MGFFRFLLLATTMISLVACSGGDSGPGFPGDGVIGPVIPDFDTVVDQNSCLSPMENVFNESDYYEEEFTRNLRSGDAPCLKKAISLGNINVNKETMDVFGKDPMLPIFRAMGDSSLFFAKAKGRSFDVLKVLHEAGADLTVQNNNGETPLLFAIKHVDQEDHPSVAQFLIQTHNAAVNKSDRSGMTTLHYVVTDVKNALTLDLLEKHGADLNQTDSNGQYPLMMSIENNWEIGAQSIVEANAKINIKNKQQQTALHRSISKTMDNLSQLLISKMTMDDLNSQDKFEETPVFVAVVKRNAKITQLLLAKKVDLNIMDSQRSLPLHSAVTWANEAITKEIVDNTSNKFIDLKNNDNVTPLFLATGFQNINYMTWLIQRGADVNSTNKSQQWTALHSATDNDFRQGMSLLLASNATVNMKNEKGQSALHLAKSKDAAMILINNHADINLKNNQGTPPIATFMMSLKEDIVMLLAQSGAALDWTGENGKTLLHLAALGGMSQATDFFADQLDINALDDQLQTPLFKITNLNTLKALLKRNPKINIVDSEQESAFTRYVGRYISNPSPEYLVMISELISAGADVNHKLSNGTTVLFRVLSYKDIFTQTPLFLGDLMSIFQKSDMNFNHRDKEGKTPLFYVDTIQEVQDLKKGSLLGPVDVSSKAKNGQTASDFFNVELDITIIRIDNVLKDIEKLTQDIEEAKNSNNTAKVNQLENQKINKMNTKDGLEKKVLQLQNILKAIQA